MILNPLNYAKGIFHVHKWTKVAQYATFIDAPTGNVLVCVKCGRTYLEPTEILYAS